MFGYVRPLKPELLVREYEAYRGVYCGVCRELGKHYGILSRLALSYDSAFYAMLLLSVQGVCPGMAQQHCTMNPLKKCTFCTGAEAQLQQAAALCVLLTVSKLKDDRQDHGKGRITAALLLPLTHSGYRKAAADYPWMEQQICEYMKKQTVAEKQPDADLDACAAPSAELLAEIFAHSSAESRILHEVGYYLGRWVYLMDAADDMEKDARTGDFNWFVRHFGITAESTEAEFTEARSQANESLNLTMSRLCAAFALLDLKALASILRNVVEKGLPDMQKQLLFNKKEKK